MSTSSEQLDQRGQAMEKACSSRGLRLTPTRREVYRLMLEHAAPVSAYELLDRLQDRVGKRLAPPTVYRALEFLLAAGFIHRIESRNAYVACDHPGHRHESIYFICSSCGTSFEGDSGRIARQLSDQARHLGFAVDRQVVEVHGRCADCGG